MLLSIAGMLNFNLFGIPMVGSDICGFMFKTTKDLCARWMQLGAFYPFSRNHNVKRTRSQEPYVLGPTVLETSRVSLKLRYSLLKYYYTLFVKSGGYGAIIKPLFYNYPLDNKVYSDDLLDTQFLIGNNLMVTPILKKNTVERDIYLPSNSTW